MEKKKTIKCIIILITCLVLSTPVTIFAAPGKAMQKKIYREFVQKRRPTITTTYKYNGKTYKHTNTYKIDAFVLLDMNKDGVYELFTTDNSYNKKMNLIRNNVFTIKNGDIKELGSFDNSVELYKRKRQISYNYKRKGVVAEDYIHHGKCNTLKKYVKKYNGLMNYDYKYVGNKPYDSLVRNIRNYPYRNNNASNRDIYL